MFKRICIIVLLLCTVAGITYRLDTITGDHSIAEELMYFPSGVALRTLAMGNQALLADLVWLRFVQYYGEHRLTDRKYTYMYHILDILTTLNPAFVKAYHLGSLLLTHDAQQPDQAERLIKKGMRLQPDKWSLPFYYAFINFIFLKDYKTAQIYFQFSARKPNAPDMPSRWAAYVTFKQIGDLQAALQLWLDLYNTTTNEIERSIAEQYIKNIQMQIDLESLNEQAEVFQEQYGRAPSSIEELVELGFIETVPVEPHGAAYEVKHNKVFSTYKGEWRFR